MFYSLNKKIIYTIAIFFFFTSIIFLYSFYVVYGNKIQEEQVSTFVRNQQYLELLYENISLRKQVNQQNDDNQRNLTKYEKELSLERKLADEALKNYNNRYETIKQGILIIFASAVLLLVSMMVLWFMIRRLVISPLDKLVTASEKIAQGDLSARIKLDEKKTFHDEIDSLSKTFNKMAENIETNIKEIRNRQNFLQSLIDGIPDGISVIDKSGNIIVANKEYYRLINVKALPKNSKCYNLNHHQDEMCSPQNNFCPLHEIFTNKNSNVQVIQEFASNPGRQLAINAAKLKLPTSMGGHDTFVVTSIRDLSDDIKFSHQQKLASLGFLATSVAHEMKNHLGSIRMIIEALLDKYYTKDDNSEVKQYLTMVEKQLVECINVPERLLKLTHSVAEQNESINCYETINEVINLLDYEAKRNGINVKVVCANHETSINGSNVDFKMVIINLMQNAFKAMPNKGKLIIEIQNIDNNKINIAVQDSGSGIDKNDLPHIFKPFFTKDKNSNSKGTGLGLAIVKSVVESFKGEIKVTSIENKGSTFTMTFPKPKV